MTKYYYKCEEDRQLIMKSFNNIALLIFGTSGNNQRRIEAFDNFFEKEVSEVNIYPQGTITEYLNRSTPGISRLDSNGKLVIEMLGYAGASNDQFDFIKHEGTHEFCHSFVDLLPKILEKNQKGIIKNGIKIKSHMGMIKETDSRTGKSVGQSLYGKMFNETSMDIITSMAINCFDSNNTTTVDEILQKNFRNWNNATTGYSIFTSLTRLAIAAFSNNGNVNYQRIVNDGASIFDAKTTMMNGESIKLNDFLYGIVFDQLHIEEEFDKIMGEGYYRVFCEYLDRLLMLSLNKQQLPPEEVKRVMNILPDFLNRKIAYYQQRGMLDVNGSDRIVGNFNRIWNSMQYEYKAYFTHEDIEQIAIRAGRR